MVTLKELEQFQRQQARVWLPKDVDVAGARLRYVSELQRLQRKLRIAGWVGQHGIPEAFPGTNTAHLVPSAKVLPTTYQAIERFRRWGKHARIAVTVARHLEELEVKFQRQVAAVHELPPRSPVNPSASRKRLAQIILRERQRRQIGPNELARRAALDCSGLQRVEQAAVDAKMSTIAKIMVSGFGIGVHSEAMLDAAAGCMNRDLWMAAPQAVKYTVEHLNAQAEADTGQPGALFAPAAYLKDIREQRGLSLLNVAHYAGCPDMHESHIRRYESGSEPLFTHFLGWANGLRLSALETGVAWTLYMQRDQPSPARLEV